MLLKSHFQIEELLRHSSFHLHNLGHNKAEWWEVQMENRQPQAAARPRAGRFIQPSSTGQRLGFKSSTRPGWKLQLKWTQVVITPKRGSAAAGRCCTPADAQARQGSPGVLLSAAGGLVVPCQASVPSSRRWAAPASASRPRTGQHCTPPPPPSPAIKWNITGRSLGVARRRASP